MGDGSNQADAQHAEKAGAVLVEERHDNGTCQAPGKTEEKVGVIKVPPSREPKVVRRMDTEMASLIPKFTTTYRVIILANPSLKPGTIRSVGMGMIPSKMCRAMARPVAKPK